MLAVAAASTLLGTSDFSIVAIAMPSLVAELDAPTSTVVWIALSYQLVVLGLAMTMGRLGDLYGRRVVFGSGAFIYATALALSAVAPGVEALVALRAVQGLGSAMMISLSVGLVTTAFPPNERGKALGMLASVAGLGLMAGPALGGILLDTLGWRSIFWARAPLGYAAFVLAMAALTSERAESERRNDFAGAALLFLALALMAVGLNRGSASGWTSPVILLALGGSVAAAALFTLHSLRTASPVVDLRMFRNASLSFASGLMLVTGASMMAVTFVLPFYLLESLDLTPIGAGLMMLFTPAIFLLLPTLAGRLSDRIGPKAPTTMGLAASTTALLLFAGVGPETPLPQVAGLLALAGVGGAFFQAPNQTVIMRAAPPGRMGTVSALIPTLRYVGIIVGVALAEALFTSGLGAGGVEGATPADVAGAARTPFLAFGAAMAVATCASLLRPATADGGVPARG